MYGGDGSGERKMLMGDRELYKYRNHVRERELCSKASDCGRVM